MGWQDRLTDDSVRPCWYLFIAGVPYLFGDESVGELSWAAPRCARHGTDLPAMTVLADVLQISGGIESQAWNVDERTGIVEPGTLTLRLTDNRDLLMKLFATRLKDGHRTRMTETLGWDASGTGEDRYHVQVESTTGFAAEGNLFSRRESMYYKDSAATRFGADPEDPTKFFRGCWVWRWGSTDWDRWHTAYRHRYAENDAFVPEVLADYPTRWRGRRAVLLQNFYREQGGGGRVPIDSDWRGPHEFEVYSGIISAEPVPAGQDWDEWEIHLAPLTSLLDTTIGTHAADGEVGLPSGPDPWILIPPGDQPVAVAHAGLSNGTWVYKDLDVYCRTTGGSLVADELVTWPTFVRYLANGLYREFYEPSGTWANWPSVKYKLGLVIPPPELVIDGQEEDSKLNFRLQWNDPGSGWTAGIDFDVVNIHIGPPAASSWHSGWVDWDANTDDENRTSRLNAPLPHVWETRASVPKSRLPLALSDISKAQNRVFKQGSNQRGFAVLETGECIYYPGIISVTGTPDGYEVLQITQRGALGTSEIDLGLEAGQKTKIKDALGLSWGQLTDPDIWRWFLYMAISTGGGARESTYDSDWCGREWGAALCPSLFDHQTFEAMGDRQGDLAGRIHAQAEPIVLADWMKKEAAFAQAILCQRPGPDGVIRIGVFPVGPSVVSEAQYGVETDRVELVADREQRYNSVSIPSGWHAGKAEFQGPTYSFPHVESIYADGKENALRLEVPGLAWSWQDTAGPALQVAVQILARHLEPGQKLLFYMGAEALLFVPGQTVALTCANVPTDQGVRGLSGRPVTIVGVQWCGYDPDRDWQTRVWCRVGPSQRLSTYAPSAKVASYSSGPPPVLTLEANDSSEPTDPNPWVESPTTDAVWFRANFGIYVWNEGDWSNGEAHQIVSRSGNDIELDSGLTLSPGVNCYVTYLSWDHAYTQTVQKRFAHVADDGSPPTLGTGSDEAFEYA